VTFRRRLSIALAIAVAVAVALASIAAWFVVRGQLRSEVDDELRARAGVFHRPEFEIPVQGDRIPQPPVQPGQRVVYLQIRTASGALLRGSNTGDVVFAIPAEVVDGPALDDQTVGGTHFRVYSERFGSSVLTIALPLTDVDASLRRLALIMLLVTVGGVALAAALGRGLTAAAAAPVSRLTRAAERVRDTGDLSLRIEEPSAGADGDELGRLAASFNAMLGALETSVTSQRRLVADASHELRTPITSIRTNLELLASGTPLEPGDRERMLGDVTVQLEELTSIVNDLVELARDGEPELTATDVRLDALVADAVSRAERHARHVRFTLRAEPTVVRGDARRLERAVINVLDNAAKWSPIDGEVDVTLAGPSLRVRDRGPGFAADDAARVFDRFYRSPAARAAPGSGLGLAIVRQVVEAHGGRVTAANDPAGGGVIEIILPTASSAAAPEAS
jgi:two-component system sensor histidine kinase MprB